MKQETIPLETTEPKTGYKVCALRDNGWEPIYIGYLYPGKYDHISQFKIGEWICEEDYCPTPMRLSRRPRGFHLFEHLVDCIHYATYLPNLKGYQAIWKVEYDNVIAVTGAVTLAYSIKLTEPL